MKIKKVRTITDHAGNKVEVPEKVKASTVRHKINDIFLIAFI